MSGSATCSRPRRALAGALAALTLAVPGVAIAQAVPAPNSDQPQAQSKPLDQPQPKPAEQAEPLPSAEPVISIVGGAVMGKKVVGPKGENLGLVVDVLVNQSGEPQAAVIDFGGFLGVGSRKIAIDWKLLDFSQLDHGGTVELGLDRAQIQAAPEYKPGNPAPAVVTTPSAPDATQKNP